MSTLTLRERTLIGLAVAGLLIVVVYLYVAEPLVVRSRELAEVAPAREATLEARRRLIEQRLRLTHELAEVERSFEEQAARLPPGPGRMSRRLLVLNVALGIVSVVLAVGIFRTLLLKRPVPSPSAPRVVSAPTSAAPAAAVDAGPAAYTVIAARNLFNSNRNETAAAAAAPVVKPILHGVVIVGARSRAFLEDPMSKRVA